MSFIGDTYRNMVRGYLKEQKTPVITKAQPRPGINCTAAAPQVGESFQSDSVGLDLF